MTERKEIIILGAGYAGVEAAKVLLKKDNNNKNIRITLIDKNPYHTLMTELHEVAGGRCDTDSVRVSLKKIFGGKNINVVIDTIETINFAEKVLISNRDHYKYNYLIICTGADPVFFDVPGVKQYAYTLWSYDDAEKIRDHIEDMFHEASRTVDPDIRKEILTFVVAGGGFTGVEMAGEIIEWKKALCAEYHIDLNEVNVVIVEALGCILSVLPESLQKKAMRFLKKKKCDVQTGSMITEMKEHEVFIKNRSSIKTRTLIWTCGVQGTEFCANLTLSKGKCSNRKCEISLKCGSCKKPVCEYAAKTGESHINGKRGRLLANEYMQSVDQPEVYIAGDNIWFEEKGKVLPQVVETALQTAEAAAHNIIASISGKKKKPFRSNYHGFMVSIGSRFAVANVMNMKLKGFVAMAMKHVVNLHYLLGLAGVNACWEYIKHHFLDVKDDRSMIGGLASYKHRTYWITFLRLFLGGMWLYEGINKVLDGWLDPAKIFICKVDAVSSATTMTTTTTEAVTQATTQAASTATEALLKEPLGIYTWFLNTFIVHNPFPFQAGVVLGEIGIGLALIGGLFTFLASAGSIGLCLMFIISAMAGKEIFWYMAAAVVMLSGGGRGFGLDYWVIPFIKKWWNGTKLARITYFYFDEPTK